MFDQPMTEEETKRYAHKYNLMKAQMLLEAFERATGTPPKSMEELEQWYFDESAAGRTVNTDPSTLSPREWSRVEHASRG